MTEIEITKDNWEAHYPIPETGDKDVICKCGNSVCTKGEHLESMLMKVKQTEALQPSDTGSTSNKKRNQELIDFKLSYCHNEVAKARLDSLIARAVEEERLAWLQGERCTICGESTVESYLTDMCGKCLEEV